MRLPDEAPKQVKIVQVLRTWVVAGVEHELALNRQARDRSPV